MLGLVANSLARFRAHWRALPHGVSTKEKKARDDISERIRARYDTARKRANQPTRQWLLEHGVRDDWIDAWRAVDR
jgi:hypothetical protein